MRPATSCLNLYRPPAIAREAGAGAERWLDLVKKVYPDNVDHLLRFFAQRVQRPEVKINHGLVLGGAPGVGKDTILEGLKHAIGPWNFAEISPAHLLGTFNSFIKSVVLRVSEARDLGEANRYSFHDHTKTLMSAPPDVLRCNEKFTHEHAVFNVTGVIITTNHKTTGLYLPEDDRRHYVAWSKCVKEDFEEDFWREFWGWYYTGGLECVAGYLHEYDLRDFDPKAPPVKTEAFWAIVDANRGPEESEAADAIEKLGRPPALTLDMLVGAADYSFGTFLSDRKNRRIIPHRLEKIGYVPVANPDNKQRLWVVPDPLTKHTKQQMIYARNELPLVAQLAAVRALISLKK
jgi:hypothetical protein